MFMLLFSMLKLAFINGLNLHQTFHYVFIVISSPNKTIHLFRDSIAMIHARIKSRKKNKFKFPKSIKIMQTFSPHFFLFNFIK